MYDDELFLDENGQLECLDAHLSDCSGPVEWRSIDPPLSGAFPRCDRHWGERLDSREQSLERYATSSVAPSWFDPADAGESWDDSGW